MRCLLSRSAYLLTSWTRFTRTYPGGCPSQRLNSRRSFTTYHARSILSTGRNQPSPVLEPTIYALSTAPGLAAIAVIRVSGSGCRAIYETLCPNTKYPKPRYATLRSLYAPKTPKGDANLLDSGALVLSFPRPHSVTGEDVLEFHVHGGTAVVKAVLVAIGKCTVPHNIVRYAEPGEFTRRAFFNDRLDLPQIEALGDTLSAVTEEQRRLSVRGTVGGLAERYTSWRQSLLNARGELEALIDFAEDQHFDESPASLAASVAVQIRALASTIACHSANAVRGELLRSGISISLIGSPNVGKSSLLNQIVGRNAAIVSKEAGTTRDVVEVGLDLGGFFCRLGDTAGLRKSLVDSTAVPERIVGEVEQEGIKRAKAKAVESDVVILVLSVEKGENGEAPLLQVEQDVIETAEQLLDHGKRMLLVVNKMDQYNADIETIRPQLNEAVRALFSRIRHEDIFHISCLEASAAQAKGLEADAHFQTFLNGLIQAFKILTTPIVLEDENITQHDTSIWQESLGATERQRALLDTCYEHLCEFLTQVHAINTQDNYESKGMTQLDENEFDIVLAAESLRAAAECLARLTGRGDTGAGDIEDVLGVVFEKFCVGK